MLRIENQEQKVKHQQIQCSSYIINLIVQAFLFINIIEIDKLKLYNNKEQQGDVGDKEAKKTRFCLIGLLSKIYNIIIYIQGSTTQAAKFIKLIGRLIPLNNYIRQNSQFLMLFIALDCQGAIKRYYQCYKDNLEDNKLTPKDQRQLYIINNFLEPFQTVTLYIEGDYAIINQVLFIIDILIKHFQLLLISKICLNLK